MNSLLETKRQMKSRRPKKFTRSDTPGKKRLAGATWRRPKGLHNKVKDQRRGHKAMPNIGYGTPRSLRNTNRNGLLLVRIATVADLEKLDKNKHAAIIASTVGGKKRILILQKAAELGITVQGVKDSKSAADAIAAKRKSEQDARKQKLLKRKESKDKKQKVKTQKEALKEKASAQKQASRADDKSAESAKLEDKKLEEKKELDKLLTQKE